MALNSVMAVFFALFHRIRLHLGPMT